MQCPIIHILWVWGKLCLDILVTIKLHNSQLKSLFQKQTTALQDKTFTTPTPPPSQKRKKNPKRKFKKEKNALKVFLQNYGINPLLQDANFYLAPKFEQDFASTNISFSAFFLNDLFLSAHGQVLILFTSVNRQIT